MLVRLAILHMEEGIGPRRLLRVRYLPLRGRVGWGSEAGRVRPSARALAHKSCRRSRSPKVAGRVPLRFM
jgi:hypothetical protein